MKKDPSLAAGGSTGVDAELAYHALAAHDVDLAFSSLVLAGSVPGTRTPLPRHSSTSNGPPNCEDR